MAKFKPSNTVVELEMQDGTTVRLTLAYKYLYQLSAVDRRAYDEYNAVWNKKPNKREEMDTVRILYAAYLCAAIQDGTKNNAMGWEEFLELVPINRQVTSKALEELLAPKRKGDIGTPSK